MTNPAALVTALERHRVTHLTAVPTLLAALLPHLTAMNGVHCARRLSIWLQVQGVICTPGMPDFSYEPPLVALCSHPKGCDLLLVCFAGLRLRHIVSSGEPLSWRLAEQLQRAVPQAQLLNLYGTAEVRLSICMPQCLKQPM